MRYKTQSDKTLSTFYESGDIYLDQIGEKFLTLPLVTVVGVPHGSGQVLHICRDLHLLRLSHHLTRLLWWRAGLLIQLADCLGPEGLFVSLGEFAEWTEVEILGVTRP